MTLDCATQLPVPATKAWIVSSGGTASNTSPAALVVLSHGIADPTTIYSGASETISKGGADHGAQVSGGVQSDYGLASGTTTIFAGSQVVESAGTAIGTTVSNGGTEVVSSGGKMSGAVLSAISGGGEIVSSGESAVAAVISGGTLEVASGGNLTLLGQYSAANFNTGGDGHGTLITDPPGTSSVAQTQLVEHH